VASEEEAASGAEVGWYRRRRRAWRWARFLTNPTLSVPLSGIEQREPGAASRFALARRNPGFARCVPGLAWAQIEDVKCRYGIEWDSACSQSRANAAPGTTGSELISLTVVVLIICLLGFLGYRH